MNTEKKLVTKCLSVFPAFQSSEIAIRSTSTCPECIFVCVEDFVFVFVIIRLLLLFVMFVSVLCVMLEHIYRCFSPLNIAFFSSSSSFHIHTVDYSEFVYMIINKYSQCVAMLLKKWLKSIVRNLRTMVFDNVEIPKIKPNQIFSINAVVSVIVNRCRLTMLSLLALL